MDNLEKSWIFSTRVQLLLHRFPLHLDMVNTSQCLQVCLSTFLLLLNLLPSRPRHRTESASTNTLAFAHLIASSFANIDLSHDGDEYLRHSTFRISSDCSCIKYLSNIKHTLDILEFRIQVDFRIFTKPFPKCKAAFIDITLSTSIRWPL